MELIVNHRISTKMNDYCNTSLLQTRVLPWTWDRGLGGIHTMRALKRHCPRLNIVSFVTGNPSNIYIEAATSFTKLQELEVRSLLRVQNKYFKAISRNLPELKKVTFFQIQNDVNLDLLECPSLNSLGLYANPGHHPNFKTLTS
eukprot:TRINITY_DN12865_c0_g1_i1.p1 TRINITY_DN12865_c0_g1~~TRINITY_DN12865_c0_g1_i1.p1  ORF type:complete len:144 (-),score=11.72 TRINITY_DN12865_c0_g1_i1:10-441(-)